MTASSDRAAEPPRRRRRLWVLMSAAGVMSLALLAAGVAAFFADPGQTPTALLDVLDKRASVVSMFLGGLGLLVSAMALWAQLRSPALPQSGGLAATGRVFSSGTGSPAVGSMSDGMVVGQVSGPARVSGPRSMSAEAERSIAIGGDVRAPMMSGDGTIAFTGRSGGRAVSVTGELSDLPGDSFLTFRAACARSLSTEAMNRVDELYRFPIATCASR